MNARPGARRRCPGSGKPGPSLSRSEWMLLLSIHHSIPLRQIKGGSSIDIFTRKECPSLKSSSQLEEFIHPDACCDYKEMECEFPVVLQKNKKRKNYISWEEKKTFFSGFLWIGIHFPSLDRKKHYDKKKFSLVETLQYFLRTSHILRGKEKECSCIVTSYIIRSF